MMDETIIFQTKLNWIAYAKGFAVLVLGLFADSFGILLIFVTVLILLGDFLNIRFSEFTVTDKRVLIKDGFFRTQLLDIKHTKIEGIHIEQGVIGKIVNRGSIVIRGKGGIQYFFFNINNPLEFGEAINEQISRLERGS
jgi:uncharacterized membrane protein YdbT with pleckstrin-like domain